MSQNSLVLPISGTLSGLNAVQDINNALDTLNTLASGASAPSSPEAGQFWHDTANKIIKIRSMDNTTWIPIGTLNETAYTFAASLASALTATLPITAGGTGATTAAAALAALISTAVTPIATSTGTIPLPGGMIANFGQTGTIAASGYNTYTFATAFPNGVFTVLLSVSAPGGYSGAAFTYDGLSTSSVNIHNQYSGGALSGSYLVIGH